MRYVHLSEWLACSERDEENKKGRDGSLMFYFFLSLFCFRRREDSNGGKNR
jgi:hypothetical protein